MCTTLGYALLVLASALLNGCVMTVGGTVTGLTGTGLVLQNNGGDDLLITANGDFIFSAPLLQKDAPYAVAVKTQPGMSVCTVTNGTGNATASVSDVEVRCVPDGIAALHLLAGGAVEGDPSGDGTGASARFINPSGVAVDNAGNAYVADAAMHTIRKISPAGEATTLAGLAGNTGSADGTGAMARFNTPKGIAVDGAGMIYVSDSGNHTVRKITPAGEVTTLAGMAGVSDYVDAVGTAARFRTPDGIAVDSTGVIYVIDSYNTSFDHPIRRISPSGDVTTLVRTLYQQFGIAVDSAGTVYVTTYHAVRKITPFGLVTLLAGSINLTLLDQPSGPYPCYCDSGFLDGMGTAARFNVPAGVAVNSAGNIYVADAGNHTVRKVSPAGMVSTVVGVASTNSSSAIALGPLPASLGWIRAVAVSDDKLFISSGNVVLWAPKP